MPNPPNYKPWPICGLMFPIRSANFMPFAKRDGSFTVLDHRIKTDMRIRMQQKTHE